MIKRVFLLVVVLFFFPIMLVKAAWKDIYAQVLEAYIEEISVEDLAVAGLKGLNHIDKELMVANDSSYVTLYYRGKVLQALRKPKERKDTVAWGDLTEKIVNKAVEASALASEKDFKMEDVLAESMVSVLDKDSKFYASMDDVIALKGKNHRVFSARIEGDLLYIRIKAFNKQTEEELAKALSEFHQARAIVVDVRGCPGGMSGVAVKVADMFLTEGIIISTVGKVPAGEIYYPAYKKTDDEKRPMFVLVDGKTASAAEIFAIAMQEQGRARIIGSQSKGKGTLQKLISLSGGGVLAITNGLFKTPSGYIFNQKGINPDVCTFEQPETADVQDLIKKGKSFCSRQEREDATLEMKVVEALMPYVFPQN